MFTLIACIGKNNEIGKKGKLVFNIKEDMDFFRETTTGRPVVMGYNTWLSLPQKLKNRKNIVISYENVTGPDEVITDLDQFIKDYEHTEEEFFIIGGGMIYHRFLPHASKLYLTEVDTEAPDADVYFPNFNKHNYKRTVIRDSADDQHKFVIVKYTKKKEEK